MCQSNPVLGRGKPLSWNFMGFAPIEMSSKQKGFVIYQAQADLFGWYDLKMSSFCYVLRNSAFRNR